MGKDKKSKDGLTKEQNKKVDKALKVAAEKQRLNLEVTNLELEVGKGKKKSAGKAESSPTPEQTAVVPKGKKGDKSAAKMPYMSGTKKGVPAPEEVELPATTEEPQEAIIGSTDEPLTKAERKAAKKLAKANKGTVEVVEEPETDNPFEAALDRTAQVRAEVNRAAQENFDKITTPRTRAARTPKFAKEFRDLWEKANSSGKPKSWMLPDGYSKSSYGETNIIAKFREEPYDYNISVVDTWNAELEKFQFTVTIDPDAV